jgi:ubiquinone/menaquinone biosynthesis C-methylase UbiE
MEADTTHRTANGTAQATPVDKREFWNGRAKEFSEYAAERGYHRRFIRIMRPRKSWTVLDMGCGGGTIAIPLAPRVKSITAADFSEKMLEIVDQRCREAGITNVETVQRRWEDEWNLPEGSYDVAIASRSLIGDDTKALIGKLDRAARTAVYISTVVGCGPFDKALFESTGRTFTVGEDYMHYYKVLYEMGIKANVNLVAEEHRNGWSSHEEALEDQRWMFHGMTPGEEEKVRQYLATVLVRRSGQWRLPYSKTCHWAVMWWTKGAK